MDWKAGALEIRGGHCSAGYRGAWHHVRNAAAGHCLVLFTPGRTFTPTQRWLGLESNWHRLPGRRWCCLPKDNRESGYPELGGRALLTADHLLLYVVLHFSWI